MSNPDLCDVADAAAFLNTSADVVRTLLRTRALVGVKVGGQWRIPRTSLAEYLVTQIEQSGWRRKTPQQ